MALVSLKPQFNRTVISLTTRRLYTTVTPLSTTTTTTTSQPKHTAPSTKLHRTERTILNLISTRTLFPDNNHLHAQITTLVQRLKSPKTTPVIIGLIGAKPSLLNSLLIDVYADSKEDQIWFDAFKQRDMKQNNLVRFSDNVVVKKEEGAYDVPSPILKELNVEFEEINETNSKNLKDKFSFCLAFNNTEYGTILGNYPTYLLKDVNVEDDVLGFREVNTELYEKIITLLKESPLNSSIYAKEYPRTNIAHFREILAKVIASSDDKLFSAIITNLQTQLSTSLLNLNQLETKTSVLNKLITTYSEHLNLTFQRQFKPSFHKFQFKTLPWWKLYVSINRFPAQFREYLDKDRFLNDSIKQYSYIQGQITTGTEVKPAEDSFAQKEITQDNPLIALKSEIIENDIPSLQKHGNKLLYTNFVNFQLPLIALSNFGVLLMDYPVYHMGSIALLGLIIGFNNISRDWVKFTKAWEISVLERFRGRMLDVEKGLRLEVEDWSDKQKSNFVRRENAVKQLLNDEGPK